MTLVKDPVRIGLLLRFVRIYREKRRPRRQAYTIYDPYSGEPTGRLVPIFRPIPRRAAAQIAWAQARQTERVENGRGG